MRTIHYIYSSLGRQFLLIILFLVALSRLFLLYLGTHYQMKEFAIFNLPASIALLGGIMVLALFLFLAHRFFSFTFNEDTISYKNSLLNRERDLCLQSVKYALFTSRSIKLYGDDQTKALFKIPFYKFGVVLPFGIESFEQLLQYKNIPYDKKNFILPSQTRGIKFLRIAYWTLAIGFTINFFKVFILCVLIIKHYQ